MAKSGDSRLILQQSNFLALAFVRVLREAFSDDSTPEEYRYAPIKSEGERGERQIAIFRTYPKRHGMIPCLVVETDTSDVSVKQLGEEVVAIEYESDKRTVKAKCYGGVIWIPVKISIFAHTATDRALLTDLVSAYIRYVFRPLFLLNNIDYLDIDAGEVEVENIEEKPIFVGEVNVRCQTEFRQWIDLSLIEKINKISLDDLKYGTSEDDLTPIPRG